MDAVFYGLLGLAAGMLVNYLADVLPAKRSLATPLCLHCGKNIPSINYLLWPRRCPHCGKRRSARTWIVEAVYIALFIWLAAPTGETVFFPFWLSALIWIYFGVVVVIDIELRLILHPTSIAGAVLALLAGIDQHGIQDAFLGGLAGYLMLLALYWIGVLFTKLSKRLKDSEEVALGFGDVNLAGVLGLLLGWPNILMGLMISVLLAGAFSLVLIVAMLATRRYRAFLAIPYGPFLVAGTAMLLFLPSFAQALLARAGPLFWIGN